MGRECAEQRQNSRRRVSGMKNRETIDCRNDEMDSKYDGKSNNDSKMRNGLVIESRYENWKEMSRKVTDGLILSIYGISEWAGLSSGACPTIRDGDIEAWLKGLNECSAKPQRVQIEAVCSMRGGGS